MKNSRSIKLTLIIAIMILIPSIITIILLYMGYNLLEISSIIVLFDVMHLLLVTKFYIKPLSQLTNQLEKLKESEEIKYIEGNILNRKDRFGHLAQKINLLIDKNATIISNIKDTSESIGYTSKYLDMIIKRTKSSIDEIVNSSNELSNNAQNNTEAIENGVVAIEQLAKGSEEVARNTEELNAAVGRHITTSESITRLMEETAKAIEDSSILVKDVSEKIETLVKSAENIGKITDTIMNISGQTNLLALNASIEAARAGSAGKGFAVVADEIKKLANESNNSAGKIAELIESVQSDITNLSLTAKKANDWLYAVVEKTFDAKSQILDTVNELNNALTSVEGIATITEEQAASSQQIYSLIENLKNSVKTTEIAAQEINRSIQSQSKEITKISGMANELEKISYKLNEIFGTFNLNSQNCQEVNSDSEEDFGLEIVDSNNTGTENDPDETNLLDDVIEIDF
jgi:methyl-accepting chemotaxis protein